MFQKARPGMHHAEWPWCVCADSWVTADTRPHRGVLAIFNFFFLTSRKVTTDRNVSCSQSLPWPHPDLTVPSRLGALHSCHFSFNQSTRVGPQIFHPNRVSRLCVSTTDVSALFYPTDTPIYSRTPSWQDTQASQCQATEQPRPTSQGQQAVGVASLHF